MAGKQCSGIALILSLEGADGEKVKCGAAQLSPGRGMRAEEEAEVFLGIPRETGSSEGLTSFISFPLLQSAGFPSGSSRDGSLSQDHTAGSGLTQTPLSQSCASSSRAAPGSKAVASLLLLWEGARCDGTGKMGEEFGKD